MTAQARNPRPSGRGGRQWLRVCSVVEHDGYRWTTEAGEECRGCEYARMFPSLPCTVHGAETPALVIPAPSGVSS